MAGQAARIRAELAVNLGRLDDARAAVRDGLERLGDDARLVAGLVAAGVSAEAVAAERARATGRSGEASMAAASGRGLLSRLDEFASGANQPITRAFTLTAHAESARLRLAATNDPDAAAHDRWREVAATWEALPCPYRAGWARLREAESLLAADAGRAAASEPLRAAAAIARRLRAATLEREVELLAARPRVSLDEPASASPPEPAPAGLTPREIEVLAHVAAGRTNREIGDALYISPRTAGVHVSRILAKLGAATRGEAAAAGRLAGAIDEERVGALLRRSAG